MNRLYFGLVIVLSLHCLTLSSSTELAEASSEINGLRKIKRTLETEKKVLEEDNIMLYGKGYHPGQICQNTIYRTDEGYVYRIGECE